MTPFYGEGCAQPPTTDENPRTRENPSFLRSGSASSACNRKEYGCIAHCTFSRGASANAAIALFAPLHLLSVVCGLDVKEDQLHHGLWQIKPHGLKCPPVLCFVPMTAHRIHEQAVNADE